MTKDKWLEMIKTELRKDEPNPLVVLAAVGWYDLWESGTAPDWINVLCGFNFASGMVQEVIKIAKQELEWEERDASNSDDIAGTA